MENSPVAINKSSVWFRMMSCNPYKKGHATQKIETVSGTLKYIYKMK